MIQNGRTKAGHQQVFTAIIVVIKPERIGNNRKRIIAARHSQLFRHVGKRPVTVVVKQMAAIAFIRIRDVDIIEPVAIVIAHRGRRSARREHAQNVAINAFELARVM